MLSLKREQTVESHSCRQRHRRRLQHQQQQQPQTTAVRCASSNHDKDLRFCESCANSGWAGSRLPSVPNTDRHGHARICLTIFTRPYFIFGLTYSRYAWLWRYWLFCLSLTSVMWTKWLLVHSTCLLIHNISPITSQITPVRRSSVIVHPCQTGPTMSSPAMSTFFSLVRHCPVLQFQSPMNSYASDSGLCEIFLYNRL